MLSGKRADSSFARPYKICKEKQRLKVTILGLPRDTVVLKLFSLLFFSCCISASEAEAALGKRMDRDLNDCPTVWSCKECIDDADHCIWMDGSCVTLTERVYDQYTFREEYGHEFIWFSAECPLQGDKHFAIVHGTKWISYTLEYSMK